MQQQLHNENTNSYPRNQYLGPIYKLLDTFVRISVVLSN